MAISQQDIKARIAQIQAQGGGNTAATRAQIAQEAQKFGVTPEQLGAATNLTGTQIRQLASEAGQAFEPLQLAGGGMLGGNNIDLTTPSASSVSLTSPADASSLSLNKYEDPFNQAISDIYTNTTGSILDQENVQKFGGMFKADVESGQDPKEAASKYVGLAMQSPAYQEKVTREATELYQQKLEEKDPYTMGTVLFNLYSADEKVQPQALEQLFGPEDQGGYSLAYTAGNVARGLEQVNLLSEQGNTKEAQELLLKIQSDPEGYASELGGDAWKTIRDNVLTEDTFYGRSSGGGGGFFSGAIDWAVDDVLGLDDSGGLVGSIERMIEDGNPIETLDRWKNKGPAYVAAGTLGFIVGGPAGASAALSVLGANNTLDSGENLSTAQIIGLAMNAGAILDLGSAMYTAAGGGELGAGFLSEQSIMNATQNFGLENVDFASLSSNAEVVQQTGELVNEVNTLITEPIAFVADKVIDKLGGADYLIEQAGSFTENDFIEGISKGVTSAAMAEATNKNPITAFLGEVKGLEQFLPSLPGGNKFKEYYQSASRAVAPFEDYLRDQGLDPGAISEQIAQVEDWAKANVYDPEELMSTISQIEDTIKENVDLSAVEDTIVAVGDTLAEAASPVKDALIDAGDAVADAGDAVADAVSGLDIPDFSMPGVVPMEELAGTQFTAKRGRQEALPVDTTFYYEEPLLSLAILQGKA